MEGVDLNWMLAVAALASSHNIKALDPIDKVTVITLKVGGHYIFYIASGSLIVRCRTILKLEKYLR